MKPVPRSWSVPLDAGQGGRLLALPDIVRLDGALDDVGLTLGQGAGRPDAVEVRPAIAVAIRLGDTRGAERLEGPSLSVLEVVQVAVAIAPLNELRALEGQGQRQAFTNGPHVLVGPSDDLGGSLGLGDVADGPGDRTDRNDAVEVPQGKVDRAVELAPTGFQHQGRQQFVDLVLHTRRGVHSRCPGTVTGARQQGLGQGRGSRVLGSGLGSGDVSQGEAVGDGMDSRDDLVQGEGGGGSALGVAGEVGHFGLLGVSFVIYTYEIVHFLFIGNTYFEISNIFLLLHEFWYSCSIVLVQLRRLVAVAP